MKLAEQVTHFREMRNVYTGLVFKLDRRNHFGALVIDDRIM
jgi:hypothetical protein